MLCSVISSYPSEYGGTSTTLLAVTGDASTAEVTFAVMLGLRIHGRDDKRRTFCRTPGTKPTC